MQFAASIAADGDQRQIGNLTETGLNPQALQQLVDKFGSGFNKLFSTNAAVKCLAQPVLKDVDAGFDTSDGQFSARPDARVLRLVREGGECGIRVLFRKSIHMRHPLKSRIMA